MLELAKYIRKITRKASLMLSFETTLIGKCTSKQKLHIKKKSIHCPTVKVRLEIDRKILNSLITLDYTTKHKTLLLYLN